MRPRRRVSFAGAAAIKRRTAVKHEFWPDDVPWRGPDETGYFCAPRSLPLILSVLRQKNVSGDKDPGNVYVELLACHAGQGVVEMSHPEDHAYGAGYTSIRSWRDRMRILERAGFIKTTSGGNRPYAQVFLVHPSIAMQALRDTGAIPDKLWQVYRTQQIDAKEPTAEVLMQAAAAAAAAAATSAVAPGKADNSGQ